VDHDPSTYASCVAGITVSATVPSRMKSTSEGCENPARSVLSAAPRTQHSSLYYCSEFGQAEFTGSDRTHPSCLKTFYYLLRLRGIVICIEVTISRVGDSLALGAKTRSCFTWDHVVVGIFVYKAQFAILLPPLG
jgi:hypothetical protein